MKKQVSWIMDSLVAVLATIGLLAGAGRGIAQEWVESPEDQSAALGQSATFTAEPKFGDLSFQWLRQWPDHDEILKGQTRSSLTLSKVAISDVGLYACAVAQGDQIQITRAASLMVFVASDSFISGKKSSGAELQSFTALDGGGGTLTLFGPPIMSSGSSGSCPGAYAGYVNYTKTTSQGWGWAPDTNTTVHTASDLNRTDTKVTYVGKFGDTGCAQTVVTVPHSTYSPKYRFSIYFPNNVPTTNAYPITLTGFNP